MTQDARFEDGGEAPLRLRALDGEDLQVISSLVQDAVLSRREIVWKRSERRFAMLINRFRWEDMPGAERHQRSVERVRAMLVIEDVERVRSRGLEEADEDAVLSLLAVQWRPRDETAGSLLLTLAGHAEILVEVEALEVVVRDVTRPYAAPSGRTPDHP